jgi:transposase-like protein
MKEGKIIKNYSEAFKIEKVKMIESHQMTVIQLSRIYNVSGTAIYKWIRKYSTKISKAERMVIEKESEGAKTLELLRRIADLERVVGQKQLRIDYLEKAMELGSEEVGYDIKKKYVSGHLHGSNQGKEN